MRKTIVISIAVTLCFVVLIIVNAPPEDSALDAARPIPISKVFEVLEAENDTVRKLWTEEIVGAGQKRGLEFNKLWRTPELEAGPLPALFLRETAESLRRSPLRLYLFLGSDFPINDANQLTGLQNSHFLEIRETGEPQFFYDDDTGFQIAMFPDVAVAETCVRCHNKEPETTKSDWKLGDIMGASTWSYPASSVSLEEAISMVQALRIGFRESYDQYIEKVASFANPPKVGKHWPTDGYYLPSTEVFIAKVGERASPITLQAIIEFQRGME